MYKSGFIAIVGRPNGGKSTFLNSALGEKLSIVTDKPQTTRNRIRGIKNIEPSEGSSRHNDGAQIVFIDTPGVHTTEGQSKLNEFMVDEALHSIKDVDGVLFVVDSKRGFKEEEQMIVDALKEVNIPVVLALNKIDGIDKERLLPLMEQAKKVYDFTSVIPMCATNDMGTVQDVLMSLVDILPEGEKLFPGDDYTDVSERFIVQEVIREKLFKVTQKEIPYSIAVVVEEFKEDKKKKLISIKANINVERDSQKGIVIGKGGKILKIVGSRAREDLEKILGSKIYLELFVRVQKDWTKSESLLKQFGYKKER